MVKLAAIISVHAQLPKNVVPNAELDLDPTNWEWKETLAFPVSRLNDLQFSLKPYKWIRYVTGIVIGARGELCTERDLPNPVPIDYDASLSTVSIDLYYHTTDQEKRCIFPIDPNLGDTRTATPSGTNTLQDDFRDDLEDRDKRCVMTGAPAYVCHAVHLLPHSKGSKVCDSYDIILAYNHIGGSILRRSQHTDVESPVMTTTLYETLMTLVMVCSSRQAFIVC